MKLSDLSKVMRLLGVKVSVKCDVEVGSGSGEVKDIFVTDRPIVRPTVRPMIWYPIEIIMPICLPYDQGLSLVKPAVH